VSTPPLTLVAGEIRMPRLRPLDLVSRSLGREWALLPPNVSFRTELRALYAAMLRTFCLSADSIRAMCRWDPQSLRQQPVTPAAAFGRGAIGLNLRDPVASLEHASRQRNRVAGGACAIGGAAAIAWLVANYPRQPPTPALATAPEVTLSSSLKHPSSANPDDREHVRSGAVDRRADVARARDRAQGDLAARTPVAAVADSARRASGRSAPLVNASRAPQAAHASAGHIDAIAPHGADERQAGVAPQRMKQSGIGRLAPAARGSHPARRERSTYAHPEVRRMPQATDHLPAATRRERGITAFSDAPLASLHRARPLPSTAGAYSPLAPSPRPDSDYESITMSARTHVGDMPTAPVNRGRVNTDSTDWMNHISQRRVTEVPERFSK
jgi:hypothetical protein